MTKGRLSHVEHFDSKAEVETYVRNLPIKRSFFMAAFYMQNFQTMFKPRIVILLSWDGFPLHILTLRS